MKLGEFMSNYKRTIFNEKLFKKSGLETSSRPFEILKIDWLYWVCNTKTIKLYQNQHEDFV